MYKVHLSCQRAPVVLTRDFHYERALRLTGRKYITMSKSKIKLLLAPRVYCCRQSFKISDMCA